MSGRFRAAITPTSASNRCSRSASLANFSGGTARPPGQVGPSAIKKILVAFGYLWDKMKRWVGCFSTLLLLGLPHYLLTIKVRMPCCRIDSSSRRQGKGR
jgi:hypothetical protein